MAIYGLNRTLGTAIGSISLVALLSSGVVYAALGELRADNDARNRSETVLAQVDHFRTGLLDQETGVRGYLLTGRESSLQPYYAGRAVFSRAEARLRALAASEPDQGRLLGEADAAAREWQTTIGDAVVGDMAKGDRPKATALESSGAGKARFDAVRAVLAKIEAREQAGLVAQNPRVRASGRRATGALALGALITLVICAGVGIAVNRLITKPLVDLAGVMGRLVQRDMTATVTGLGQQNEVGDMARAVAVFKDNLVELDRTALLRVTADTLPAMVGYIDAERRVGFLNGEFARWFAFEAADVAQVQGRAVAEVFARKPLPGQGDRLERAFAGEEERFEQPLTLKTGEWRDLEAYFRPHRGPGGMVLGVVALLTDITDRKDLDRRLARQATDLQRSNEELEQFAYVASHDLKAPLRGIENLVGWIEEDLEAVLTPETRGNMDLLKSRVHRLEALLDDLLAYSRAGRADAETKRVDTRVLVEELAALISPPEGFRITADASLPSLVTARAPLMQALQNLIGNAVKHHPEPGAGQVEVSAEPHGAMTEFVVVDNGPGIPERYRERVFGMFQTLRPRDEIEGSGMGLAIVKKIVERQGGAIWLSEGARGGGLAAHFTWPTPIEESQHGPAR